MLSVPDQTKRCCCWALLGLAGDGWIQLLLYHSICYSTKLPGNCLIIRSTKHRRREALIDTLLLHQQLPTPTSVIYLYVEY